jgi:hypothetical protein
MYVCMYVRTYVCMYVRTYVRMYVCMYVCSVTDHGSVFKSRTMRTEEDKLSWSFCWLNYESRNMGYVAELHSHTRQALVWDEDTV